MMSIFSDSAEVNYREVIQKLHNDEKNQKLDIIKNGADLINAINWMPAGFLFAGKMSTKYGGVCGTVSTLIGMYQLLMAQKK